jgi:uncharacterized membrane protein
MRPGTLRIMLAALFTVSGTAHVVVPAPFVRIVPPFLPRPDVLVAVSGAAELAGAAGLLVPATRHLAAWGLIALLVSVYPANIQMLAQAIRSDGSPWWRAALRLPLQPVLIWAAWKARS